ncbi:MAG TPA: hypothetical protein VNE71_08200 [Myxococcota bacterium]|nr:hypothetical protein [Myxococcota bacterium]
MRRSTRLAPLFPALLCLGLGSPAASAEEPAAGAPPAIYKWVDANGVAHYTTELSRVPRSVRGSVRSLGSGSAPPSEGFAARDAAAAPPAPAVEPLPEWDVGDAPPPAPPPAPPLAPAPARDASPGDPGDRWAGSDRPVALPDEEPGAAPAVPTQTAAAEPPAGAPAAPSPAEVESQRQDLDARIAALEAEIASDEDALKGFLAVPGPENPAEIAYDQSFREVAERLPRRLAELRSLKGERAQLEAP